MPSVTPRLRPMPIFPYVAGLVDVSSYRFVGPGVEVQTRSEFYSQAVPDARAILDAQGAAVGAEGQDGFARREGPIKVLRRDWDLDGVGMSAVVVDTIWPHAAVLTVVGEDPLRSLAAFSIAESASLVRGRGPGPWRLGRAVYFSLPKEIRPPALYAFRATRSAATLYVSVDGWEPLSSRVDPGATAGPGPADLAWRQRGALVALAWRRREYAALLCPDPLSCLADVSELLGKLGWVE